MTTRTKGRPPIPEADRDEAARLIWDGYLNFLIGGPAPGEEAEPKAFANRHAAGKAALAHLDQLYKVAGGPASNDDAAAGDALAGHLGAARAGIASLEGEGADTDDDDAGDG